MCTEVMCPVCRERMCTGLMCTERISSVAVCGNVHGGDVLNVQREDIHCGNVHGFASLLASHWLCIALAACEH